MPIHPSYIRNTIFSDQPISWLIHARAFHYAGLKMVEMYQSPPKKAVGQKATRSLDSFKHAYLYKIAIYLLSHSIELLFKAIYAQAGLQPEKEGHKVCDMYKQLSESKILKMDQAEQNLLLLIDEYLKWFGRYYKPLKRDVEGIIQKSYQLNEQGLLEFKYPLDPQKTHLQLSSLFESLMPNYENFYFDVAALAHYPEFKKG